MTGGGVLVTNGEYDGGRNFVVYNNDGGCKGVGAFVVTGE